MGIKTKWKLGEKLKIFNLAGEEEKFKKVKDKRRTNKRNGDQ